MFIKKDILRIKENNVSKIEDVIITEFHLHILVNNKEIATIVCSPKDIKELVYGFMFTRYLINFPDEIDEFVINDSYCSIKISFAQKIPTTEYISSSCCNPLFYLPTEQPLQNNITVKNTVVQNLVNKLQKNAFYYKLTGGTHISAVAEDENLLFSYEDISRHNAVDKVIGRMLLDSISPDNKILIVSGRISSDIVVKTIRMKIPIIVSFSTVTDYAIKLAENFNITLIGFARGKRFNVYTNSFRICNS